MPGLHIAGDQTHGFLSARQATLQSELIPALQAALFRSAPPAFDAQGLSRKATVPTWQAVWSRCWKVRKYGCDVIVTLALSVMVGMRVSPSPEVSLCLRAWLQLTDMAVAFSACFLILPRTTFIGRHCTLFDQLLIGKISHRSMEWGHFLN